MPDFWDIAGGIVDIFDGDQPPVVYQPPYAQTFAPTTPGTVTPAGSSVVIDPKTGKIKCKRRRRRRLLTESDFNDLMRIATLPNKQNVTVALAKAIGRSR